jgi:hypothetical protein
VVASRSIRFTAPIPLNGLGGSRAGLDVLEKKKLSRPCRVSRALTLSTRSVARGSDVQIEQQRHGADHLNVMWRNTSRRTHARLTCCLSRRRHSLPLHSGLFCNSLLKPPLPQAAVCSQNHTSFLPFELHVQAIATDLRSLFDL